MADEDENEKLMAEAMKGEATEPAPDAAGATPALELVKEAGPTATLAGEITKEMAKAKNKFIQELADDAQEGDDALNKLKIQNIDFILDVPLKVSVELGRAKVLIKDLLQLGQGSVLELDKLAGESLEILVNGKLIARGEVVVVNEKFGVRIKEIISPVERIDTLR